MSCRSTWSASLTYGSYGVNCCHSLRTCLWEFVVTYGTCMMEYHQLFETNLPVFRCLVSQTLDWTRSTRGMEVTVSRPQPLDYYLWRHLKTLVYKCYNSVNILFRMLQFGKVSSIGTKTCVQMPMSSTDCVSPFSEWSKFALLHLGPFQTPPTSRMSTTRTCLVC